MPKQAVSLQREADMPADALHLKRAHEARWAVVCGGLAPCYGLLPTYNYETHHALPMHTRDRPCFTEAAAGESPADQQPNTEHSLSCTVPAALTDSKASPGSPAARYVTHDIREKQLHAGGLLRLPTRSLLLLLGVCLQKQPLRTLSSRCLSRVDVATLYVGFCRKGLGP